MKTCIICGKGSIPGIKYKRRGQIKRTGGAGSKIVGKTLRRFRPNLQRIVVRDSDVMFAVLRRRESDMATTLSRDGISVTFELLG